MGGPSLITSDQEDERIQKILAMENYHQILVLKDSNNTQ